MPLTPTPQPRGWWRQPLTTLYLGVPAGNGYYPQGMAAHPAKGLIYVHRRLGGPEETGLLSIVACRGRPWPVAQDRQDRTLFGMLSGAGLMRSSNRGQEWDAASIGLRPDPNLALHDLCFAPHGVLYALFTPRGLEGPSALYSCADRGYHWHRLANGLEQESDLSTLVLATDGTLLLGTRQR